MNLALLFIVVFFNYVAGYPFGAPASVCDTMTPGHFFSPQSITCPFVIQPETRLINDRGNLSITLRSLDPEAFFKGFLLIGFDEATLEPTGQFIFDSQNLLGKTKSCQGSSQSMATHQDDSPKSLVTVTWEPIENYEGTVIFRATFVQDFSTYWVKETSPPVTVARRTSKKFFANVDNTAARDFEQKRSKVKDTVIKESNDVNQIKDVADGTDEDSSGQLDRINTTTDFFQNIFQYLIGLFYGSFWW